MIGIGHPGPKDAHRRMTFKAGTLSRFIQRYGIGMRWQQIPSEPDRRRYVITLTRPDASGYLSLQVPFFQGFGIPHPPDLELVMWTVGHDTLDYHLSEGDPYYYIETFGIRDPDEIEEALRVFEKLQEQTEKLKTFLGEEGYNELVKVMIRSED
jgi:hypothetical protein